MKEISENQLTELQAEIWLSIVDEFEMGIDKYSDYLKCEYPDYKEWQSSYADAIDYGIYRLDECVAAEWEVRIKNEGWDSSLVDSLKGTDSWNEQSEIYLNICNTVIPHIISKLFVEHWDQATQPCKNLVHSITGIVLEHYDNVPIVEEWAIDPPQMKEIEYIVSEYIDGRRIRSNE